MINNKRFEIDELHTIIKKNGMEHIVAVTCKYDPNSPATKVCHKCGEGLCSFCGYVVNDEFYCNECWEELPEEGICNKCGAELEPIYENNGFTEPAGPSKWEISGYKSCSCERSDDNE